MNRRKFLRLIPIAITAGVVAPKLLIPKDQPFKWIDKKEWDNHKYFIGCDPAMDNSRTIIMKVGEKGMKDFHNMMIKYQYKYNSSWMRINSSIYEKR